jgi:TRAP-type C4-dicarboxylate transport system substrate-binding protein
MVDTVYAPPLGALALQWHSYTSYMSNLPLNHTIGAVLITRKYFNQLPDDLANLLKRSVDSSMADLTVKVREQAKEAITLIQDSGVKIVPAPTGPDLEKLYKVHDQVAQRLTGKLFSKDLLDRVYVILKRSR